MATQAQIKASEKYDRENTRSIMLKLNMKNDSDILRKLSMVDNKQGYIKQLIRDDLRYEAPVLSLESIKILVLPAAKRFHFEKLFVFGSYARGTANPESDIDIVFEGGTIKDLFQYSEAMDALEKATGKQIDLVSRTSLSYITSTSDRLFYDNVKKEEVLIYDRSQS